MNPLAIELNRKLEGTAAFALLSSLGKRFYFPKGIVAQSMEATKHAHRYNATIGTAGQKGKPLFLPSIRQLIPSLDPEEIFPYASTPGLPELRDLWKKNMEKKNPDLAGKPTSHPLVVAGITSGISIIADLFIDPGDTIIIPDMFWGNYRLIFEVKKEANIVSVPFFNDNGKLDLPSLQKTIERHGSKEKLIILLNFPNNPTGYSPTVDEIEPLVEVLYKAADSGSNLLVITDDSYFGLFFEDNIYPQSVFAALAGLHRNILAVKLDGSTKEDFVWGFRIGFLTYGGKGLGTEHYHALEQKTMGLIRSTISNSSRLGQSLIIRALKSSSYEREKEENVRIVKEKYDKIKEILAKRDKDSPLQPLPYNSGYFMCFRLERGSAEKLRQYLLYERHIGTVSIEDRLLRIAYANIDTGDMEELFEEIDRAVREIC
ncbi:MAG: aminotransferase class I/II-fold pyridoxal phosphate-dependent enzyme [Spirochaetales bacterium]|nr:aminotransferase class I/II-fold pyridoxal phosphate-dependent enzyme [Spirochaetales bacterium]